MEEADSGNPNGSHLQTGGSILEGDASKSIDGRGDCSDTSGAEGFKTLARSDYLASDGFLEDRSEEDEVCMIAGLFDFGQGVAGNGDNGWLELSGGVKFSDLGGS